MARKANPRPSPSASAILSTSRCCPASPLAVDAPAARPPDPTASPCASRRGALRPGGNANRIPHRRLYAPRSAHRLLAAGSRHPGAVIDMPAMPRMPQFTETAHAEPAPGDYGIHPTFAHGGEFRLRIDGGNPACRRVPAHRARCRARRKPRAAALHAGTRRGAQEAQGRRARRTPFHRARPRQPQRRRHRLRRSVHEKLLHLILVRRDLACLRARASRARPRRRLPPALHLSRPPATTAFSPTSPPRARVRRSSRDASTSPASTAPPAPFPPISRI